MRSALYFPRTEVRNKDLIRTALLTWDQLEYIAPYDGYQPQYQDIDAARAMEIIGCRRVASEDDQQRIHVLIEELLQQEIPETFMYSPADGITTPEYEMWPQKLAWTTWQLLQSKGLTDKLLSNMDYPTSQAAGLTLMPIIADVLAGETRARVTDQALAYATIANVSKTVQQSDDYSRIVPLTLKVASLDQVPISRLIAFREKEATEAGSDYRTLRHNYLAAIGKHVHGISKTSLTAADRAEMDRVFASDMEDDFRDLKAELGVAKKDGFFTKEVVTLVLAVSTFVATVATGGAATIPAAIAGTGGVVTLGGLLGARNKLGKARRELLRKHPLAFLYEVYE